MDELTLIYHPQCEACKRFMFILKDNDGLKINRVNIYENDIESNIEITAVPTLIVNNEDLLVGKACFDYIQNLSESGEPKTASVDIFSGAKPPQGAPSGGSMFGPTPAVVPPDTHSSKKK